jgi:hypothetical protein
MSDGSIEMNEGSLSVTSGPTDSKKITLITFSTPDGRIVRFYPDKEQVVVEEDGKIQPFFNSTNCRMDPVDGVVEWDSIGTLSPEPIVSEVVTTIAPAVVEKPSTVIVSRAYRKHGQVLYKYVDGVLHQRPTKFKTATPPWQRPHPEATSSTTTTTVTIEKPIKVFKEVEDPIKVFKAIEDPPTYTRTAEIYRVQPVYISSGKSSGYWTSAFDSAFEKENREERLGFVTSLDHSGNSVLHQKRGCHGANTEFKVKHLEKYEQPADCKVCNKL